MNKFGARRMTTHEGTFDSQAEYRRWQDLRLLQQAGLIDHLERQPQYQLYPKITLPDGRRLRAVHYTPDFRYVVTDRSDAAFGRCVVEDVKGARTTDYVLRANVFQRLYPNILFREVRE